MTDLEFITEIRRHIIAIIKAFMRRFGVDLLSPRQETDLGKQPPEPPDHGPFPINSHD